MSALTDLARRDVAPTPDEVAAAIIDDLQFLAREFGRDLIGSWPMSPRARAASLVRRVAVALHDGTEAQMFDALDEVIRAEFRAVSVQTDRFHEAIDRLEGEAADFVADARERADFYRGAA